MASQVIVEKPQMILTVRSVPHVPLPSRDLEPAPHMARFSFSGFWFSYYYFTARRHPAQEGS